MSDTPNPETLVEPTESEKALQTKLDEALAAKGVAEKERDDAEKRAEAAEKKAENPSADPKKVKADYQKGKNYDELSLKYKLTTDEVKEIVGA